jgi:hypothetical protein
MRAQPPTRKKYTKLSNLSSISKIIFSNLGLECRVGVSFIFWPDIFEIIYTGWSRYNLPEEIQ